MSLRDGVVAVFLGLGVLVMLLSVVGVIVSRNVYQRLHFVTPGAVLAPLLVAAAVVAKETFNVRGLQTIAAVMAMVLLGPHPDPRHRPSRSSQGERRLASLSDEGERSVTAAVQAVSMLAVGVLGALVVLTRRPENQAMVFSMYGLALTVLFLVLQAPDVALSELVVGAVAYPVMIFLTLGEGPPAGGVGTCDPASCCSSSAPSEGSSCWPGVCGGCPGSGITGGHTGTRSTPGQRRSGTPAALWLQWCSTTAASTPWARS